MQTLHTGGIVEWFVHLGYRLVSVWLITFQTGTHMTLGLPCWAIYSPSKLSRGHGETCTGVFTATFHKWLTAENTPSVRREVN